MFRFFRSIRKKLFAEGKVSRYLGYALGEIVLIVMGILIAVQINNWNEERIERVQEKILLVEIHEEFLYNRKEWDVPFDRYLEIRTSLDTLIESMPLNLETLNLDALAVTLERSHFGGDFDESITSIEKLKSTSFDIITNEELRALLLQFEVMAQDHNEAERRTVHFYREHFAPVMRTKLARPYVDGFKDPRSDLEFLESLEFENLIKGRRITVNNLFRFVEEDPETLHANIVVVMDRIIELSAPTE